MSSPGENEVARDAAWIEREYGRDKWPPILAQIKDAIAAGERSLSRVIAGVVRTEWDVPDLQPMAAVAFGAPVRLPGTVAWNGLYAAAAEAVIAACRPDTGAIIELGCGWGRSLFDVWLRGGPRDMPYYALEFTQAGLDCVAALASLEPKLRIRTARFDFNHPDFSMLPQPLDHAVIFTVSSVNQVPHFERDAYRSLLGVARSIDGLHFEEIGWQINPESTTEAMRAYALRNDYNRDLWDVLNGLSEERAIELIDVIADWYGMQPVFPMSFVHWRRGGGKH